MSIFKDDNSSQVVRTVNDTEIRLFSLKGTYLLFW